MHRPSRFEQGSSLLPGLRTAMCPVPALAAVIGAVMVASVQDRFRPGLLQNPRFDAPKRLLISALFAGSE